MRKILQIICFCTTVISCESLEVENKAQPILDQVLSNPEDYKSNLDGAAYQWFNAIFKSEPMMTLLVAADVGTSSWGFHGMREVGTVGEPYGLGSHLPINNSVTASYPEFLEIPYNGLYSAVTSANDIIKATQHADIEIDTKNYYFAYAFFLRGLAYGYLGLIFDQALVYDEQSDVASLTYEDFAPYPKVVEQALHDFDRSIEYASVTKNINITGFNGITIDKEQLIQLANGYHVKVLVHSARTNKETEALDWGKILDRINRANLEYDFTISGTRKRWFNAHLRSHDATLMRVDQKLVNMVNPESPYPYPKDGYTSDEFELPKIDARWGSTKEHMYRYAGAAPFRANRGIYFFSTWKFNEHENYRLKGGEGLIPLLKSREVRLFKAEAQIRLGMNIDIATSIINETRVLKGKKTPALSTDTDLLEKMMYERYLETNDATGNGFFDRRRTDDLGKKQFLHFPVPARNLNTWGAEIYTTGG